MNDTNDEAVDLVALFNSITAEDMEEAKRIFEANYKARTGKDWSEEG